MTVCFYWVLFFWLYAIHSWFFTYPVLFFTVMSTRCKQRYLYWAPWVCAVSSAGLLLQTLLLPSCQVELGILMSLVRFSLQLDLNILRMKLEEIPLDQVCKIPWRCSHTSYFSSHLSDPCEPDALQTDNQIALGSWGSYLSSPVLLHSVPRGIAVDLIFLYLIFGEL